MSNLKSMWLIYSIEYVSVVGHKPNGEDNFVTTVSITVILQTYEPRII